MPAIAQPTMLIMPVSQGLLKHSKVDSFRSKRTGEESVCSSTEFSDSSSTFALNSPNVRRLRTSQLRRSKVMKPEIRCSIDETPSMNFQSMGLVGRDAEFEHLKSRFDRITTSFDKRKEIFLIAGEAGTGKSSIALSLQELTSTKQKGIFIQGKFDMNASTYSGIANAFDDLCQKVMESPPEVLCAIQAGIHEKLNNSEVDLLAHLIPELKHLVCETIADSSNNDVRADEIESKLERLRYAFRALMRVFCSAFHPLILFLDDLQWADVSSLQVLDFLISDAKNDNALMIIGCYRSEEVDDNSLLHNKMVSLQDKAEKYNFYFTEVKIGPFVSREIEQVITRAWPSANAEATAELAELCLKRTLGNQFFVLEFLKMLHDEELLVKDYATSTWTWDLNKIEDATMSTANVVVMLHDRLTKLSPQVQAILQCAAYLGSTFNEATIDLIWATYGRRLVETKTEPTLDLLDSIVKEDILEKSGNGQYRWVHDMLREASLSLTGQLRASFQLDIGRTLYYGLEKQKVEDDLFAIVDLINNGNVFKLPEFAHVNLRAAQKARDLSAFQAAAEYAAHGIGLLKEDKWSSNHSLALKLYTMGAEVEVVLGNVEVANKYSREVLRHANLSTVETVPLKMAEASTLAHTEVKFDKAVEYYLTLLRELGCSVIWARQLVPVQSLVKLMKTIKKVKAKPLSFYEEMVPIDDEWQKAVAYVYAKLLWVSFAAGDILLFLLCACKLVDLTLEYGVNEFSAKAFASLSSGIIIGMEDVETATTFNMIAMSILKRFKGFNCSETTFICYGPCSQWVKPFEELIPTLGAAALSGMRAGDTEFSAWNLFASQLSFPYNIGKPLDLMLKECPSIMMHCEDTSQSLQAMATQVTWQLLKNLTSSGETSLEGNIFSSEHDTETNPAHLSFVHFAEGELLLFNGKYEEAAKRALEVGESYEKLLPNGLWKFIELFHRAIPLYAAARLTNKRKYKSAAKKLLKQVTKWAKNGNPNVQYYALSLNAEQLALDKDYDAAEKEYEEAIEAATEAGHLHHIALINERYGDYLSARSMEERSKEMFSEAIRFYKEWGAWGKVQKLETRL